MQIYAFHGFLGQPKDWESFAQTHPQRQWHLIDLFDERIFRPTEGFWPSARRFNASVETSAAKKVLLGYSLGGRFALHALLDQPCLWDAAVIVSANPGLAKEEERKKRCEHDDRWADRFLSEESWNDIMHDWDSQGVFSRSASIERPEGDFSGEALAHVLTGWSLGRQENLKPEIERLNIPILWIAGEYDQKFSTIARSLTLSHPFSRVWIAPDADHRVPWKQRKSFQQQMEIFFNNVSNTTLARM
ncbi:MAG: alpha/beta fold hydrolase [Waddliaceae bacterium]